MWAPGYRELSAGRWMEEQTVVTEAPECAHHWVLENGRAVRLSRDLVMKHPNCIGRQSTCKKCGAEKVQLEKVWDQTWRD